MSIQQAFAIVVATSIVFSIAVNQPGWADEQPAAVAMTNRQIETIMDKKVGLKFSGLLDKLPEFLRHKYHLNAILDRQALDNAGISTNTELSVDVADVSLRAAIQLLLQNHELIAVPNHGALAITTQETASCMLVTRIVPVTDLLFGVPHSEQYESSFENLMECITTIVAPHSWNELGGAGSIQSLRETLLISQTEDVHRQIVDFLRTLRAMRAREKERPEEKRAMIVGQSNFTSSLEEARKKMLCPCRG